MRGNAISAIFMFRGAPRGHECLIRKTFYKVEFRLCLFDIHSKSITKKNPSNKGDVGSESNLRHKRTRYVQKFGHIRLNIFINKNIMKEVTALISCFRNQRPLCLKESHVAKN